MLCGHETNQIVLFDEVAFCIEAQHLRMKCGKTSKTLYNKVHGTLHTQDRGGQILP